MNIIVLKDANIEQIKLFCDYLSKKDKDIVMSSDIEVYKIIDGEKYKVVNRLEKCTTK